MVEWIYARGERIRDPAQLFRIGGRTAAVRVEQISSRHVIGLLPPRLYCNNHAAILSRSSLGQTLLLLLLLLLLLRKVCMPVFSLSVPFSPKPFRSSSVFVLNSFLKTLPRRNLLAISLCRDLRADNHRRGVFRHFFGQIIIIYIAICPRTDRSKLIRCVN